MTIIMINSEFFAFRRLLIKWYIIIEHSDEHLKYKHNEIKRNTFDEHL